MATKSEQLHDELRDAKPPAHEFKVKRMPDGAIRQGAWLCTPLWNEYGWKEIIERHGGSWQDLMKAYSEVKHEFVRWKRGRKSVSRGWADSMNQLIDEVVAAVYPTA